MEIPVIFRPTLLPWLQRGIYLHKFSLAQFEWGAGKSILPRSHAPKLSASTSFHTPPVLSAVLGALFWRANLNPARLGTSKQVYHLRTGFNCNINPHDG
jgi:hypothetical protein